MSHPSLARRRDHVQCVIVGEMPGAELTGVQRIAGAPAPGQRVLAYAFPGATLLAAGESDGDGSFRLALPEGVEKVTLLATFRGEACGATVREVELPADCPLELDLDEPLHAVRVHVEGGPGRVMLVAEPEALDGVPEAVTPFLDQSAPGVFDAHFLERDVRGDAALLRLAPGRWRVSAHLVIDEPARLDTEPEAWSATAATDGETGAPLPGDASAGFTLDVDRDRSVMLALDRV
jgi:hypothetical protein